MNSKAIILLLAIASVGSMGITSQAFADHHAVDFGTEQADPLLISTDSDTYDHSSVHIVARHTLAWIDDVRDSRSLEV